MRINVYTEELPDGSTLPMCEIVTTEYISSRTKEKMTNYGIRIYLRSHPDLHYIPGRDDDRSAVTFWCGSKAKNIKQFIEILDKTYELDNLTRWRKTAGQVKKNEDGRLIGE